VLDGHPAALSWLGAVRGNPIRPLGVTSFGQSADIPDLYAKHGIDAAAIVAAGESLRG
jgi:pyruvate dehydrogenase E1 component